MNILNLHQESLQQILPKVQKDYPNATIDKPFVGLETIQVPCENILYIVRKKRTDFVVDFDFSKSNAKAVGFAFGVLGLRFARSIFKLRNRTKINQFNNSFIDIVNGVGRK
jgi:hypothetical protein